VTGRIVDTRNGRAKVELGEGVFAECAMPEASQAESPAPESSAKADITSLTAMLSAKWKQGGASKSAAPEPARAGQIRRFRIVKLDAQNKTVEVELAG